MMTYDCYTFYKEPLLAKFTLPIDFLNHLAFGTKCFIFRKKDSFVIFFISYLCNAKKISQFSYQ
jgi:hypothetical protein